MSLSSLQPTIRILQNVFGRIEYAVYVGSLSGSRADQDLLWAHVGAPIRDGVFYCKGPNGLSFATQTLFAWPYERADWLDRLVMKASPQDSAARIASTDARAIVEGAVRLVLEDCVGDDILFARTNGLRTLRQVNREDVSKVPEHIQSLIDNNMDGFRPRYYHPSYPVRQPAAATEVIKRESEGQDAVQPRSGVAAGGLHPSKRRKIGKTTQAAAIEAEDHAVTTPRPNSVSVAAEPDDNNPQATNLVTEDTTARAETERIIILPAKEKAISMIGRQLQDWRDGKIDEDTLEKTIQASLSDVRLARLMQSTVVAAEPISRKSGSAYEEDMSIR